MPIIQPSIVVPEDIYESYIAGDVKIMGLAKNADDGTIKKHLDIISDDDESNDDALNGGALFAIAATAVIALATSLTIHLFNKANQKKVDDFKQALNNYIEAVNNQTLSVDIINNLIEKMDKLKKSTRKKIVVQFSTGELAALIECLCNHTQTLAEANNITLSESYTKEENADILLKLRKNLILQKNVFAQAA